MRQAPLWTLESCPVYLADAKYFDLNRDEKHGHECEVRGNDDEHRVVVQITLVHQVVEVHVGGLLRAPPYGSTEPPQGDCVGWMSPLPAYPPDQ